MNLETVCEWHRCEPQWHNLAHGRGTPNKTISVTEVCKQLGVSRRTAYRRMQNGLVPGVEASPVTSLSREVETVAAKIYRLNANELAENLISDLARLRRLSRKAERTGSIDLAISATSKAASVAANVLRGGWLANALSGRTEEGENLEELASEELEKRLKEFEVEGVELP